MLNQIQINRILERIGALVRDEAKRRVPVDNGMLRQNIRYEVFDDEVRIFCDLPYADYVEYGTGVYHIDEQGNLAPHPGWDIVPVNKKVLRWEVGRKGRLASGGKAKFAFAKKVHVEGMKAQPYLRPALFENIEKIKRIVKEEFE